MAGVTGDDAARRAYLAEGNARQARKRVAADVLIRDHAERVLLVDPTYKSGWDLPGGMAEANEAPRDAATRELREELGLSLPIGRLLVLDWVPVREPWDDQLVFSSTAARCPSSAPPRCARSIPNWQGSSSWHCPTPRSGCVATSPTGCEGPAPRWRPVASTIGNVRRRHRSVCELPPAGPRCSSCARW